MKFELKPNNRGASKAQVIEDIQGVTNALGMTTLTQKQYKQHGRFSPSLARYRFGSWSAAIQAAGLNKSRNLNIPADECIADLKRVAQELGKNSITTDEYKDHGRYSPAPFVRHFGSWLKALRKAGLKETRTLHVTNEDYFHNLEKIWVTIGRQPYYREIQKPFSRYCAGAYERRFGSWRKALEAFVAFVNQEYSEQDMYETELAHDVREDGKDGRKGDPQVSQTPLSRHISWRIRFLVMRRDDFKCQFCGNSPALTTGLVLHVDHIHPWSKGGPTKIDNLQTLCEQCNIGKSDLLMTEEESKG